MRLKNGRREEMQHVGTGGFPFQLGSADYGGANCRGSVFVFALGGRIFFDERLSRISSVGFACALAVVALLSLG